MSNDYSEKGYAQKILNKKLNITDDADTQNAWGNKFYYGQGVPQDYKEAFKWYRLAAEQGHAQAQCDLGEMYYEGEGVPHDYAEAIKWWKLAAEQGHEEAQYNLDNSA